MFQRPRPICPASPSALVRASNLKYSLGMVTSGTEWERWDLMRPCVEIVASRPKSNLAFNSPSFDASDVPFLPYSLARLPARLAAHPTPRDTHPQPGALAGSPVICSRKNLFIKKPLALPPRLETIFPPSVAEAAFRAFKFILPLRSPLMVPPRTEFRMTF